MQIHRLQLTDFRSYARLDWRPGGRLAVISGLNGSGKTNLLEAVSLLQPGRGLRAARFAELARHGAEASGRWAAAADITCAGTAWTIGTGTPPDGTADRRAFLLDGVPPANQAEIAAVAGTVWLTPQMDRLFQEPASGRRRFLDRLTWALDPGHARQVSAYETALSGRNRLLAEGGADRAWLAGLEDAMARHGVAVAAARRALLGGLSGALAEGLGSFPRPAATLACPLAERLATDSALVVEDWFRGVLHDGRARDAGAGATLVGPHRADLLLADAATGRPAALASTGQQKALLVALILGHARLVGEARGAPPLLLLDEPAVHLDAALRAALFAALADGAAQALLTGTDADAFAPLRGRALGFVADAGGLQPDPWFSAAEPVF